MGDQTSNNDAGSDNVEEQEVLDRAEEISNSTPDPEIADIIKKLRGENARRRVSENKTAQELADALAAKAELEARLAETSTKYAEVEAQATTVAEQLEQLTNGISKRNEAVINRLPEEAKALVPGGMSPVELSEWLDTAASVLTGKVSKPPLNGETGRPNRDDRTPVLTDAEAEVAKKLGLTIEEYAKYKDKE